MKRRFSPETSVAFVCASLIVLGSSPAEAQVAGYVTGLVGIEAFSASSGVVLNTFYPGDISGTIAASSNGAMLYSGAITGSGTLSTLFVLSSSTGEIVSQIPGLYSTPRKTILDVTGTYAFVLCTGTPGKNSVTVVNLEKQKAVGYVHVGGGSPVDIAMSPNGSKLFVSVQPTSGIGGDLEEEIAAFSAPATQGVYSCKPEGNSPSVCIFNTGPFGFANTVSGVAGDIAVSQDGTWLYAWNPGENTYLTAVNTESLAVSKISLPKNNYVYGLAVAPSGDKAVVLAVDGLSTSFLMLDTQTNALAGSFSGTALLAPAFGSNVVAFSPGGDSLWSLGECQVSCSLLVGQSFPSGNLISQTALDPSLDAFAITF